MEAKPPEIIIDEDGEKVIVTRPGGRLNHLISWAILIVLAITVALILWWILRYL
jgi:hypothetical protein